MHIVVIGAYGSAGSAVAEELQSHVGGVIDQLTLVDDGDPGGGLCILEGCMPSKEVLSAAEHRFQGRTDERLEGRPQEINLTATVDRKDGHTGGWAAHRREGVHEIAETDGVEFIDETAQFLDDRTLRVGDQTIEADYVVIATGSSLNVPNLPGLTDVGFTTSADVLDATRLPDSGVVMGFGAVGLEMAPYLAEAGVDITVIEHDERPLDDHPPAFGDALLELYREEFDIDIRTEVYEDRVESTPEGVRVHLDSGESVTAAELFCFTGRNPNLDRLGLEHTSVTPERGWVDATMQTTDNPRVYVPGDANGRDPVLHVAKEQGRLAGQNIVAAAQDNPVEPYQHIPHKVTFAGVGLYPVVQIGHTTRSAHEAGHATVTVSREAADDGVFRAKDVPHGLAQVVVDADDGTVLGYHAMHYHADAMAKTMQVLVEMGLDIRDVPDRAYHPTTPEILDGLIREASARVADAE
ncbi:MAG: pyruvate/2-oxoglutarate dehydrogenase complex, dihydrolipoamide dehydrogenase-like component [Halorubrum sp. J07HR59]|jgi:Pyruvate/2-oxoglutarate dehydrogenase complex, dihydrolipoamide dehydrogenase (E3) component, and related enzymes|nr:MAG: pyruvate/2-oxoglutarate dehydrogenase complex, dihydrolipoamide dehydrogenase-like component [Halorubrum sp. J07HR59]